MTENSTIIQAETIDLAVEEGLRQLGIQREDAEVHVLKEDKKGFLGIGKQDAIVEVRRKLDMSYKELTKELETDASQSDASVHAITDDEPAKPIKETPADNQDRETSLEDQRDIDKPVEEPTVSPEVSNDVEELVEEEPQEDSVEKTEELSDDEDKQAESDAVVPTETNQEEEPAADKKEQSKENLQAAAGQVADYLIEVINEYGAEADIMVTLDGKQLIFDIDTDKSGLVIGKHGKIINALQVLAQTLLLNLYPSYMNVVLNVGDYRDRRAHVLEQMAMDAADQVTTTRRSYRFEALPSYERKQIHAHLSKMPHLKTYSEGKEPHRHLIIEYIEK